MLLPVHFSLVSLWLIGDRTFAQISLIIYRTSLPGFLCSIGYRSALVSQSAFQNRDEYDFRCFRIVFSLDVDENGASIYFI